MSEQIGLEVLFGTPKTVEEPVNTSALLSALAKEGRSLVKEMRDAEQAVEEAKDNKPRKKINYEVKTILSSYPDFILEKKYSTKTVRFVYMVSAQSAFFKTTYNSGKEESDLYTDERQFTQFMGNASEVVEVKDSWLPNDLTGSVDVARFLLDTIKDASACEYIKFLHGTGKRFKGSYTETEPYIYKLWQFNKHIAGAVLVNDDKLAYEVWDKRNFWLKLMNSFGIDNMRDYMQAWSNSPFNDKSMPHIFQCYYTEGERHFENNALLVIPFTDYKRFKEYTLFDAVQMGYGWAFADFWQEWIDTLRMERNIYNELVDKYPNCLPLTHRQLATIQNIRKEEIDEKKMAVALENCKKFSGKVFGTDLVIVSPKAKADILEEATNQSNCLASYVNRVANGNTIILFVRHEKTPDKSYMTIEVSPETYDVIQARLSYNRPAPYSEVEAVKKVILRRAAREEASETIVA